MSNFKFRTNGNTALSAGLQAVVFELGGEWYGGEYRTNLRDLDKPFFYLDGLELMMGHMVCSFEDHEGKEIVLSQVTLTELVELLTPEPELYVAVYKNRNGELVDARGDAFLTQPIMEEDGHGLIYYRTAKLVRVDNE